MLRHNCPECNADLRTTPTANAVHIEHDGHSDYLRVGTLSTNGVVTHHSCPECKSSWEV